MPKFQLIQSFWLQLELSHTSGLWYSHDSNVKPLCPVSFQGIGQLINAGATTIPGKKKGKTPPTWRHFFATFGRYGHIEKICAVQTQAGYFLENIWSICNNVLLYRQTAVSHWALYLEQKIPPIHWAVILLHPKKGKKEREKNSRI